MNPNNIDLKTLIATGIVLACYLIAYFTKRLYKCIDKECQEYKEANRIINDRED